ncbi:MAG TPA: response regulator [Ktedonobacteraceae bacterium]|nr:response regulator [Ktedonobacteraceae bacterium]
MQVAHSIFVIDGTQDILDLIRLILEEEGYKVYASLTPPKNLTDIERLQPDLIILDFIPGKFIQRWQFLQRLKEFDTTTLIPIILCTVGLREIHQQEDYLTKLGVKIIYKPFEIDDLLDAVHQAILLRSSY